MSVQFGINIIKRIEYVLDMTLIPGKSVKWTLNKKGFFKKNDGGWDLVPKDGGKKTEAAYSVDVDMGFVPGSIVAMLSEKQFPKMLQAFKERIERLKKE